MPLKNLGILKRKMEDEEKAVIVFRFTYNKIEYFVAVCLLTEDDKKKVEHALVRLCFMKADNISNYLDCYANDNIIIVSLVEFRKFLQVEFQKNLGDWMSYFLSFFGKRIPTTVPENHDAQEQDIVTSTICRYEGRDPNRIYRSYIFRNGKIDGKQKYRTEYNGQLASIRYPNLYSKFKIDKTISFAFTDDPTKEKTEEEILSNFEANNK